MPRQLWQSSVDGELFSTEEECIAHEEAHLAAKAVPLLVKECGDLFFKGEGQKSICSDYFKIRVLRELGVKPADIWSARDEILVLADIAEYLCQIKNMSPAFGKSFLAGKCSRFSLADLVLAPDDFRVLSAALEDVMRGQWVSFLSWKYSGIRQLVLSHHVPDDFDPMTQAELCNESCGEGVPSQDSIESDELAMRAELEALSDPFEGSPY